MEFNNFLIRTVAVCAAWALFYEPGAYSADARLSIAQVNATYAGSTAPFGAGGRVGNARKDGTAGPTTLQYLTLVEFLNGQTNPVNAGARLYLYTVSFPTTEVGGKVTISGKTRLGIAH